MTVEKGKHSSREVSGLRQPPNPAQICEHVGVHELNQGLGSVLPGHSQPGPSLLAQVTSCTESDGERGAQLALGHLKELQIEPQEAGAPQAGSGLTGMLPLTTCPGGSWLSPHL